MDHMNWDQIPAEQHQRYTTRRQRDYSPGRTANAGDFIWYDPWTRQKTTSEKAAHLLQNRQAMPVVVVA